jgi:hypothetical protein
LTQNCFLYMVISQYYHQFNKGVLRLTLQSRRFFQPEVDSKHSESEWNQDSDSWLYISACGSTDNGLVYWYRYKRSDTIMVWFIDTDIKGQILYMTLYICINKPDHYLLNHRRLCRVKNMLAMYLKYHKAGLTPTTSVTSTAISSVKMAIGHKLLTNLRSEMIFLQEKPVFVISSYHLHPHTDR